MFDRSRPAPRLLLALLAADILFILFHAGWVLLYRQGIAPAPSDLTAFTRDRSIPEIFSYAKWIAIGVILVLGWRRSGWAILLAFAGVYAIILLDDALTIHEKVGEALALGWQLPEMGGLRGQDLGELAIWSLFGVLSLVMLGWGFARSPEEGRRVGRTLCLLLGALVACAIGADMFHSFLTINSVLEDFVSFLEDGGEMIVGSVTLAYVAGLRQRLRAGATPASAAASQLA